MKHRLLIYLALSLFSVHLFAQNIEPLGHGVRTTGEINCFVHDSATGRIYAGGYFENIGGIETDNIAYYDGVQWHAMDSGLVGYVNCMKMMNGNLYVGGSFSRAGNLTVHNVAMWDGSNWHDMGNSVPTTYLVMSLEVFQNELYLSAFLAMGVGATGVAKWNGTGWTTIASTLGSTLNNSEIYLHSTNDTLFLYGYFNKVNTLSCSNMVAFDGINFYNYNFPTIVESMIYHHGTLYASDDMNYFHRDGSIWQLDSPSSDYSSYFFVYNDSLFATFDNNSGFNASLEIWNFENGVKNYQLASTKSSVMGNSFKKFKTALQINQKLCLGGVFDNINRKSLVSSACYSGGVWEQFGGAAISYYSSWVNASIFTWAKDTLTGDIYAGGSFLFAGDSIAFNVARWDGNQWHPLGNGFSGRVNKLMFYQNTLYACGAFLRSGTDSVNCIAKWNGSDWIAVGTGSDGILYDMEVLNNELYVGGEFSTFNGINAVGIIKYNGTSWSSAGTNSLDGGVRKITKFNNLLTVAAIYSFYFGFPNAADVAQLNGSTWVAMPGIPGGADDIRVFNNQLFAANGQDIYKFSGTTWLPTGFDMWPNTARLHEINGKLIAGLSYDGTIVVDSIVEPFLMPGINIYDVLQLNSTGYLLGGFFPDYYDETKQIYLNGAAILSLSKPNVSISYSDTSICNQQDVFFSTPMSVFSEATYEWQFPGGIPSSSYLQSPIVRYNTPGDYDVFLKSGNNYGSDSLLLQNKIHVYFCAAGDNERQYPESFLVYPNPSTELVHIYSETKIESLQLVNYQGQCIAQFSGISVNQIDIDMAKYAQGLYFVKLQIDGKWQTQKFIHN